MLKQFINASAGALVAVSACLGAAHADVSDVEAVLQTYVADYADDPTRFDGVFGIEVAGNWWHVEVAGDATTLRRGMPAQPSYYYTITEEETLHRINRGEFSMFTGMVKAFSTDVTPTDLETMPGYQPQADFMTRVIPQVFHFWNRGFPEIVPFSEEQTLPSHGGHVVVLYYQEGFRSGWGYLAPGEHANEDPRSRSNPFPSLFVALQGSATARIGGVETEFSAGNFVLVPPGIDHEFINRTAENFQFMLFMFGDGA